MMAEKTTPELPFTLGTSTGGAEEPLQVVRVLGPASGTRAGDVLLANNDNDSGIGWYDPAELMRNLSAFVPEVEPVAWLDANGAPWHLDNRVLAEEAGDVTALYAHPPVTAEPATAPSVDLVEGLNVEEWADKAERLTGLYHGLQDVVRNAGEALKEHGFTSDTLESQTLAESIHALAGRGAPSVEQIAEVLASWEVTNNDDPEGNDQLIAELHALYGTPGDAGELTDARERAARYAEDANHAESRAEKAEAEVIEWQQSRDRAEIARANAVAEVERCKAALEAAEAVIQSMRHASRMLAESTRAKHEHETALSWLMARESDYSAARAAVEAETSEEAGDEPIACDCARPSLTNVDHRTEGPCTLKGGM